MEIQEIRYFLAMSRTFNFTKADWVLTMVAAGTGVCFLPEYTATFRGVVGCPVLSPAVARSVCLISVAGRRWSPPVAPFVKAARRHPWPAGVSRPQSAGNPAKVGAAV